MAKRLNTNRLMAGIVAMAFSLTMMAENVVVEAQDASSLYEAIQKVRNLRRLEGANANAKANANQYTIMLKGGEYCLEEPIVLRPEDSGTEELPLIITSAKGERAVISGKTAIKNWQKTDNGLWVADAPMINNRPLMIRQLWVNNKKALRATQFGEYKLDRLVDFNKEKRTIKIGAPLQLTRGGENESSTTFSSPRGGQEGALELLVHQRWAIAILRIKDIKPVDGGKNWELSFCEPESHLEFLHPWPQPIIGTKEEPAEKGNSSYCLQNSLCLVDEPGEWFQATDGKIYYYPTKGDMMNQTEICGSHLETLFSLEGSRVAKVKNIRIENIDFAYTAWNRPSEKGHVTLQGGFAITEAYKLKDAGLPWNPNLENQAWTIRPASAVNGTWTDNITISGCKFSHLSATALDFVTGIKNCNITNNDFRHIGGTAIMVGSFGEGATEVHNPLIMPDDEYSEYIKISGNTVYDATTEDWGAVGIAAGYVRHCTIDYNNVSHLNYSGICVGWGWTAHDTGMRDNHIDNNNVSDFARMLYDAGGIYTLSNQPESTISGNRIDGLFNSPYATNNRGFYIYLDEATDGYTIENNLCRELKFGDNKPGPNVVWKNNSIIKQKP